MSIETGKRSARAGREAAEARLRREVFGGRLGLDRTLAGLVTVLHEEVPHYNWVGVYVVEGTDLVLREYRGRATPHVRISVGEGICGAAIKEDTTVIVDDVHADPRYLACSLETASEIVVPVRAGGRPVAEIDIDSDTPAAFGPEDRVFLERMADLLAPYFAPRE